MAVAGVLADMIDAVVAAAPGSCNVSAEQAALDDDMVDWEAVRTAPMEHVRTWLRSSVQSCTQTWFLDEMELAYWTVNDQERSRCRWQRLSSAVGCICCWRLASRYIHSLRNTNQIELL